MLSLRKLKKVSGSLALVDLPVPEPGPGEVVLKVAACGICGSDLHAYQQDPGYEFVNVPVTMGHEFAGTITAIGPGVTGWRVGQRACAIAIQFCGTCLACRRGAEQLCEQRVVQGLHYDGGMAEFVKIEARYLVPLPEELDLQEAALVEPLSVAVHCVGDRCKIAPGDLAVVTGPG
ncbi:MAG: sorbitol dehydrogenase, partial [Nitrospinota bacterium]